MPTLAHYLAGWLLTKVLLSIRLVNEASLQLVNSHMGAQCPAVVNVAFFKGWLAGWLCSECCFEFVGCDCSVVGNS
jgi:hypothetical protein